MIIKKYTIVKLKEYIKVLYRIKQVNEYVYIYL